MPYIGEIRMFAGNFAPNGWMFCEGQLLPISENDTLFVILGTTYGGDGQETFALPNLASRVPIHMGNGPDGVTYTLGQAAGTEQETLTVQKIPSHSHPLLGSENVGTQTSPGGNFIASSAVISPYAPETATVPFSAQAIGPQGGSQPHENTQPFLCINFIISLFGTYPSPS